MGTPAILEALASLTATPPPERVRVGIPARIIDIVGIGVRATTLDTSRAVIGYALDQGGTGQATAFGTGGPHHRVAAAEAAFVNGVLAHSLDYDDTHLPSILHPSASVVPAALAVAEWQDVNGAALLDAVAAGLEIAVRLGMGGYDEATRQSIYFERGQHATSICGAIGSAAAAAHLLGADTGGVVDAMGIACSMASGIIEANRAGGTVKRLHCGWAARAGVTAAQLARRGITGPPTAIEGRFGLFQAFLGDQADPARVTENLGSHWEAEGIFYKPYPANHFTHTAVDAAVEIRGRGVSAGDVAAAVLEVAPPTVRTIGDPIETKRAPETGYQAQFSGPYLVAAGLIGGGGLAVGLGDFSDDLARDPDRRALMARIDVVGDPNLLEIYPYQFPARLTVTTHAGDTLTAEVLTNRGGTDRPLSTDELATKFNDNVAGLLDTSTARDMTARITRLADAPAIGDLLVPLADLPAPPG